jgi:demethylmenaquinone methyltransferase / 2-methoxy-6-polyprenyl-1,4-benzoquinol methylase
VLSRVTGRAAGPRGGARADQAPESVGQNVSTMSRAGLEKNPRDVASMFDGVAPRYDLTNVILSLGQDHRWRRRTRESLQVTPGQRILDLAAGTGVSTAELARSGATAIACDFSLGMLMAGRSHRQRHAVPFVAGDALHLPFADAAFDAVTISFGLRNVSDIERALRELARVTRPGGRLVVCEFSRPTWRAFRFVYLNYLMRALPWIARRVSSNPDAYVYLAETIRAWPDQAALARVIASTGWTGVRWCNLTGGVVALHGAERGADERHLSEAQ